MQSRQSLSTEKEGRSIAHDNGKNKAVAFPAVPGAQAIQRAQQPIQRFKTGVIFNADHLISDDDGMAVAAQGSTLFYAKDSVPVAVPVLNQEGTQDDYNIYSINTSYDSDCGTYADNLMRRIALFNRRTHEAGKEVVNIEGGPISKTDSATLFKQTLSSQPAPGIGQSYLVVNDKDDEEFEKKHFNFHWGTVIAKSGSDVMTAETGSHTKTMKFDMYSQSDISQSFQQRYYDAKKLSENAMAFQVNFTQKEREDKKKVI
jgi:hypothetical protein